MKNYIVEKVLSPYTISTHIIPRGAKSVTVTASGKIKFELLTRSAAVVGTGMVSDWSTSTLFIDSESEAYTLTLNNQDSSPFDVYIHFNR